MKPWLRPGAALALALVLAPLLPLPGAWRASAAVAAILLAWPLALWPRGPGGRQAPYGGPDDPSPELARRVVELAWWPIAGSLPLLGLTALGLCGVSLPLVLVTWLVGFAVCFGLGARARAQVRAHGREADWPARAGLVCALALLVLFVVSRGAPLGAMDDAYDHLATIRHVVSSGRIEFPGAFYARDVPSGLDPRKGVLHLGLALAARLARVDALTVWRAAPPLLALLAGLAFAGLALALFRRSRFAVLAVVGLLLFSGDPGRLVREAYGGHWGLVVAWAGLALALSGGGFIFGVLAGLATAAVHAYSPAQLLVPLLGFAVASRVVGRPQLPGLLLFIGGALCGALPVDLARLLISAQSGNPLHEQAMPWLVFAAGPVASPLEILKAWGWAGAAAVPALIVMLGLRRERIGLFLLGAWFAPLVLLLNPWLFSFVGVHLGSVANKLLLCWEPALALPGLLLILVTEWPARRGFPRLALASAGFILALGLVAMLRGRADFLFTRASDSLPVEVADAARLAERLTPVSAVIATDPITAYALPALSGRRSIVTLQQHSPPGDDRALLRLAVTAALYSNCVPLASALQGVVEEGAGYVLSARQPRNRIDLFGSHPDPRNDLILARRFADRPDLLQEMGRGGDAILYRIRARLPETPSPQTSNFPGPTRTLAPAGAGGIRVSAGGVELTAASLPGDPWTRGAAVALPVEWTRWRRGAQYDEYAAHIRLENVEIPVLAGLAGLVSKPLRKIYLERKAGGVYRARAVEMPFRGLCPTADWELGVALQDTLRFSVPGALLPGTYRVRIALERGTLYPVLKPADLLRDEDRFSGPVLGTLEIR